MTQHNAGRSDHDDLKPFPQYQAEDAQWGRSTSYALMRLGHLKTIKILGRRYIKMDSHRRLIAEGTKP
jgi:hypothetical protein